MNSRIFVQFHHLTKGNSVTKTISREKYHLCLNGFSSIWNETKPIWVGPIKTDDRNIPELPIRAKHIYISAWFLPHLRIAWKWAKLNPDCQFYVGGPLVWPYKTIKLIMNKPSNLYLVNGYIEEVLKKSYNPKSWKVELPTKIAGTPIYSYTIGQKCYWNNCRFCGGIDREDIEDRSYNLDILNAAPSGLVWLSTPSCAPKQILDFPKLNTKDKTYATMIRGSMVELDAFKKIINKIMPERFAFLIGIEFPSSHMLEYMRKGVTTIELKNTINFLTESGFTLVLQFITHWPKISCEDLQEARRFFDDLPSDPKRIALRYRKLVIYHDSGFNNEDRGEHLRFGPLASKGHLAKLSKAEEDLNKEWVRLLISRGALGTTKIE